MQPFLCRDGSKRHCTSTSLPELPCMQGEVCLLHCRGYSMCSHPPVGSDVWTCLFPAHLVGCKERGRILASSIPLQPVTGDSMAQSWRWGEGFLLLGKLTGPKAWLQPQCKEHKSVQSSSLHSPAPALYRPDFLSQKSEEMENANSVLHGKGLVRTGPFSSSHFLFSCCYASNREGEWSKSP